MLIGVLMGGPGSEREISLASGTAVLNALQNSGYNAIKVDVTEKSPELPDLRKKAFLILELVSKVHVLALTRFSPKKNSSLRVPQHRNHRQS